jgi:hypothetical protein
MLLPFKEIGKVGKKLLVQLGGVSQNYKEVSIVEEIDFDTCPVECPFFKFDVEKKKNICMSHCLHNRQMKSSKVVYMNERHKYNIKKELVVEDNRLSKFQTLQLLSYHLLNVDSQGFVPFVSVKSLAEKLNCTVRTLKNNNKRMVELGMISVTYHGANFFSVQIKDYDKYHLTKQEGGTGYVQMTKGFLEALFSMDNVNSIRLAIRALLKFDDEVEVRKQDVCRYSYNDIKRFMPSNINHKKIIDELLMKTQSVFDIVTTDGYIEISLKDEFNGKVQKEEKEKEFKEKIEESIISINEELFMAGEEGMDLSETEIEDLSHLSMEYGIDLVLEGLKVSVQYIQGKETPDLIENIGGFIRTVIRNNFIRNTGKMVA